MAEDLDKNLEKTARILIERAFFRLQDMYPLMGPTFSRLGAHVYTTLDLPAPMASDQYWRLYFNPNVLFEVISDFLNSDKYKSLPAASRLDKKRAAEYLVGFIVLHELTHILNKHSQRSEFLGTPPGDMTWNTAADIEIHNMLVGFMELAGIPEYVAEMLDTFLKGHFMHADKFQLPKYKSAEWYYKELQKQPQPPPRPPRGPKGPPPPGPPRKKEDDKPGKKEDEDDEPVWGRPKPCDSGSSDRHRRPWERPTPKEGGPGFDKERGDKYRKEAAEQIKRQIEKHSRAKPPGDTPLGQLYSWAEGELGPPKRGWFEKFILVIKQFSAQHIGTGRYDLTYVDYHRRRVVLEPEVQRSYPPGHEPVIAEHRRVSSRVYIILDTSGSMIGERLRIAMRALLGYMEHIRRYGGKVWIYHTDAAVHEVQEASSPRDIRHATGGGGTAMDIGIREAVNAKEPPDAIMVLTDGETPWPDQHPKSKRTRRLIPTLIVIIGHARPPSWARHVHIIPPEDEE